MLIPAVIIGVAIPVVLAWRRKKQVGMTGKRLAIYQNALVTMKKPDDLRKLATAFEGEGLIPEADMLRKRAAIRELPKNIRLARRQAFSKAINSKNEAVIRKLAEQYRNEGCTGAAAKLFEYADTLVEEAENLDVPIVEQAMEEIIESSDTETEDENESLDTEAVEEDSDEKEETPTDSSSEPEPSQ